MNSKKGITVSDEKTQTSEQQTTQASLALTVTTLASATVSAPEQENKK
jgi:hypothetical protein